MKTLSNETRSKKAISMINSGATWKQVCEALHLCKSYLQKIVKATYKTEKGYNNLLAKAKANQKAIEEANKLIVDTESDSEEVDDVEEVIVVESGYLLKKGMEGIASQVLEVFIPIFCIKELEKLSKSFEEAEQALQMIYGTNAVTPLNLRYQEVIFEEPSKPVKSRTYGVVAVCCYLWNKGYHVRLLTNSREIEDLAIEQGIGIRVERVS